MAQEPEQKNSASNTYLHYLVLRLRAKVRSVVTPYLKKMRRAHLLRRERYIFTDKKHPEKGIFSAAMGAIAVTSIVLAVKNAFDLGGSATPAYAVAVILAFVIAVIGFVFGVLSHKEKDVFYLFPNFGIFFNGLALLASIAILLMGLFL